MPYVGHMTTTAAPTTDPTTTLPESHEINWLGRVNTYWTHGPRPEAWRPAEHLDDWDLS